jgi:DNA polymerase
MLGCGYRLGGGELYDGKKTGLWGYAENMGVDMTREQAHRAVKLYRVTYPEIPEMWKVIEDAVAYVMATGKPRKVGFLTFLRRKPYLLMRLPTGRCIHYYQPRMQREIVHTGRMIVKIAKTEQDYFLHGARIGEEYEEEETYTRMGLSYMGKQQNGTKWIRIPTHGGRFMEQATQATAREVFAIGMKRAHADGFKIVGHSHDENITMTRKGDNYHTLDRLIDHMRQPIDCMPGLPLNAAGYVAPYYRKD